MTTLSKDEVVKMAREAGAVFDPQWGIASNTGTATFERFATLCRAPLVAEVERLEQWHAEMADNRNAIASERDTLKAELARVRAGEPVLWQYRWTNPSGNPYQESRTGWKPVEPTWNQTVQQKCDKLRAYRFEGKPTYEVRGLYVTPPQPAAQEPTSAVPVVKQLVEALEGVVVGADESWTQACKELNSMGITSVPVSNASAGLINRQIEAIDVARTAIAAGQKYLKENGK